MSAWVVSHEHISALINAADRHAGKYHGQFDWAHKNDRYTLQRCGSDGQEPIYRWNTEEVIGTHYRVTPQTLGQMLLDECLRSVWYRYPDDTLDGLPGYMENSPRAVYRHHSDMHVTTIAAIKNAHCYDYQSCEHPEWEESVAAAFIANLVSSLTHDLPGYDEAPWGLSREEAETAKVLV